MGFYRFTLVFLNKFLKRAFNIPLNLNTIITLEKKYKINFWC